jgi:hypothetical protein
LCASLSAVALFVVLPAPHSRDTSPTAQASLSYGNDRDHDLLADVFETFLGTNPQDPDSDADGIPDGFEYVLRSNPLDWVSRPAFEPTLRMSACVEGSMLRITFYLLPADPHEIEAYSAFLYACNQSVSNRLIDISAIVPRSVTEAGVSSFSGITASCFTFSFPIAMIERIAPVSIGMAARISGVCQADIISLDVVDGVPIMARGAGIPPEVDPSVDDQHLPWDPLTDDVPDTWGDQQVCVTSQVEVGTDAGITTYEITSAGCDALINRSCPPDCSSRVGGTVTTIDYAFLIASVGF